MRDINRIDRIIDELKELWKLFPDQRLTQLIENYITYRNPMAFFQEDDVTEKNILETIKRTTEVDTYIKVK